MARVVIPSASAITGTDKVLVRIGSEGIVREIPASALMGLVSTDVLNDSYVPKTGEDAQGNRVITGIGRAVVGGSAGPKTDPVRVLVDDLWIAQSLFPIQSGPTKPFKYISNSGYRISTGFVDTDSLVAESVTHQFEITNLNSVPVTGTPYETLVDVFYTPAHSGNLLLIAGAQVALSWSVSHFAARSAFWRLVTGTSTQRWENRAIGFESTVPSAPSTGNWQIVASPHRSIVIPVTAGVSTRYRLQAKLDASGPLSGFSQNTLYFILFKR